MSTQRAIDTELAAVLAAAPRTRYGAFDLDDIPGTRAAMRATVEKMTAGITPNPTVSVSDLLVPRPEGSDLVVRLHRPQSATTPAPVVLWFHSGGQILVRADEDDLYLSELAKELSAVVAAVDYRLAPEHQAPAAAEDGLSAYQYLLDHASDLGIDTARIAIAGASGGGAPALATAYMVRDRGLAAPRVMTLLYPMIDDRNTSESSRAITDVGVWDRPANVLAWSAVLGDRVGAEDLSPYAAPARQTDLSGLPTTFVALAEHDVLRDEGLDLATRLLRAGVQTEIHHYAGTFHAWDRFAQDSALAQELNRTWRSFLARELQVDRLPA